MFRPLTFLTVIPLVLILSFGVGVVGAENTWVRNPSNPVLVPGPTAWDSWEVLIPRIYYDGSTYQMWYSGWSQSSNSQIGYATSSDGISWTKSTSNPVLSPGPSGAWDSRSVSSATVVNTGSAHMMWYQGTQRFSNGTTTRGIGLATSVDGITWTKSTENPVMQATPGIDQSYLSYPWVLKVADEYKMWYTCRSTSGSPVSVCFATSSDGIHWSKRSTSVFYGTGVSTWDLTDVYSPNVLFDGNVYGMWYSSCNSNYSKCQIGYAISKDGIAWLRAPGNPVLGPDVGTVWDSSDSVDNQGVVQVGGTFKLYYSADQGPYQNGNPQSYKIGLAESPAGFTLPEFQSFEIAAILPVLLGTSLVIVHLNNRRHR